MMILNCDFVKLAANVRVFLQAGKYCLSCPATNHAKERKYFYKRKAGLRLGFPLLINVRMQQILEIHREQFDLFESVLPTAFRQVTMNLPEVVGNCDSGDHQVNFSSVRPASTLLAYCNEIVLTNRGMHGSWNRPRPYPTAKE